MTPNIPKDRIARLRSELNATADNIRKDARYSDIGRRNALAHAYAQARGQAAELREKYEAEAAQHRHDLERDLFGIPGSANPSTLISWRDAQDRAANIPDESAATRAIARARLSGDTHLAKAVLQQAVVRGWESAIYAAEDALPGSVDKIKELEQLPNAQNQKLMSVAGFAIPAPPELSGAKAEDIEKWAGEATPPPTGEIVYDAAI